MITTFKFFQQYNLRNDSSILIISLWGIVGWGWGVVGNMELSYCIEKNSSYLRSCCSSGQGQRWHPRNGSSRGEDTCLVLVCRGQSSAQSCRKVNLKSASGKFFTPHPPSQASKCALAAHTKDANTAELRICDVYPGSNFYPSRIFDPGSSKN
jgi:hypothetical protein